MDSPLPKSWGEAIAVTIWGTLTFAAGFEAVVCFVDADYRKMGIALGLMFALIAILIYRDHLRLPRRRVPLREAASIVHERTRGTLFRELADAIDEDVAARTRVIIYGLVQYKDPNTGRSLEFHGVKPPSRKAAPILDETWEHFEWIPDTDNINAKSGVERGRFNDVTVSRPALDKYIKWVKSLNA